MLNYKIYLYIAFVRMGLLELFFILGAHKQNLKVILLLDFWKKSCLKESKHTNFIPNEVCKGDFVISMEIQMSRLLKYISLEGSLRFEDHHPV